MALVASGAASAQAPAATPTAADPRVVVGAPAAKPMSGAALDQRTEEVGALLRCPVCQGLSVADSPSAMAVAMKHQVKELLALGYSQEQILAYFERSYGEFVRLEPPLRGVNWLVWLAPVGGLLAGGFVVMRALRSPRTPSSPTEGADGGTGDEKAAATADLPDADDPDLVLYLLRVREMAYGWPGGVRPATKA